MSRKKKLQLSRCMHLFQKSGFSFWWGGRATSSCCTAAPLPVQHRTGKNERLLPPNKKRTGKGVEYKSHVHPAASAIITHGGRQKEKDPSGRKENTKKRRKKKRKRDNYEGGVKPRAVLFTAAADADGDGDRIIAHEWKGLVRLCRQRCHFPKTHTPKGWVHTWVVFFIDELLAQAQNHRRW